MPAEVILSELPIGVSTTASRGGETVSVLVSAFLSSEDGYELITHLEQFPSVLLTKAVGMKVPPSKVDNLLAIVRRDKTATVYVNELIPQLISTVAQDKEPGQPVFMDDIIDITSAELGVEVPADAGVVVIFSWGWRKGFFYDFGPLGPDALPRTFDFPAMLGELYARLMFQDRYRISADEWAKLFERGWFPFVGLGNETIGLLLSHLRAKWEMDELIPRITEEVRRKVPSYLQAWLLHPTLATHSADLEKGVSHFASGDYVSCAGLLYPLIEALLKSQPLGAHIGRPGSLLMPNRFEQYLYEVYLPILNPAASAADTTSKEAQQKAAVTGILVVHQLFHSLKMPSRDQPSVIVEKPKDTTARKPVDAVAAANRWSQWLAKGTDEVLTRLIEDLDTHLPVGWKRLQGEALAPFRSGVRTGSAWYSIDSTSEHVGVTLSTERAGPGSIRGGRVWFAGPPYPPTATIPDAWCQVMKFLDEGIVTAARKVGAQILAPGTDELFLAELPPDIAALLLRFSRSAQKIVPLSPHDAQRWHAFVIGAFRARVVVDDRRLLEWFVSEGWDRDAAFALNLRFSDQCRLLSRYVEEVATA